MDLKKVYGVNVIINARQDPVIERFLEEPEFRDVEKYSPMSAKLLWGVRAATAAEEDREAGVRHTSLLTSLRDLVDAVRLTSDRTELLSDILDLAIETTHAESGSIMLLSPQEDVLRMEVARGLDEEIVRKVRVALGEGVSGRVAKECKPVIISGKAKDEEFFRLKKRRDVKNSMCVPLIVGSRAIGVINVNTTEAAHTFSEDDLAFLTTLAGLAAEVIQRSSEFEELRVDAAKFALWKELEVSMSAHKPLHKRLNMVCRKLSDLVPGLTCFIYLYDEERKRLFLRSSSTRHAPTEPVLALAYGEGIEGWMIDNMKEVILVDRTDEGVLKRSYMALPMTAKGHLVGAFTGQMISSRGLSKYNEAFLKDIVSLISERVYINKKNEDEMSSTRKIVAVDETGLELISMKGTRRLLDLIVTASADILGAEGASLRVRSSGAGVLTTAATSGLDSRKVRDYFAPIETETVHEALRKGEIVLREFSDEVSPYIRGVLACPLKADGEVTAVLTLFNKFEEMSAYPCAFTRSDAGVLTRFAVYMEKVLDDIIEVSAACDDWDVVSPQLFRRRVEEELDRARRLDKKVVLVTVKVNGLKGVAGQEKDEFIRKLLSFVSEKTRSFDTVALLDEETIGILYPEADEGVTRALGMTVFAERPPEFGRGMYFGHATCPVDGLTFDELLDKASVQARMNLHRI